MRFTSFFSATAVAGTLAASLLGVAGSANAATSTHRASARTDWKVGAKVVAAREGQFLLAARKELAADGHRYAHERVDLTALIKTPETGTTASQRHTATRATRELNGFFHTPGLYGVAAGNAKSYARADWIKGAKVNAVKSGFWLAAAKDELSAAGSRFATERAELAALTSIPLTNTTAKQRATAHRDGHRLNSFFHTPHRPV